MLDRALISGCEDFFFSGDVIVRDAASEEGIFMGVANLYLDPDNVVTIFFSTALLASMSGLVTIASPSGIVG
jgi:hypothetical protein